MDTNLVVPVTTTKCQVIFDYFLDVSLVVSTLMLVLLVRNSLTIILESAIPTSDSLSCCCGAYLSYLSLSVTELRVIQDESSENFGVIVIDECGPISSTQINT